MLNCFWMASPHLNAAAAWQTHLQSSFGVNIKRYAAIHHYMLLCRLTDTASNINAVTASQMWHNFALSLAHQAMHVVCTPLSVVQIVCTSESNAQHVDATFLPVAGSKTGCSKETRLVLHIPSSCWKAFQLLFDIVVISTFVYDSYN